MCRRIEVTHLHGGVHARIGPARAMQPDRMAGNPTDRRLQHILHGAAMRLALPALETVSGVFHAQCNSHHRYPINTTAGNNSNTASTSRQLMNSR